MHAIARASWLERCWRGFHGGASGATSCFMAKDEQGEVIAFLSRGSSYGPSAEAPRRVDTHISHVFLTGDRVFKLKRAVRYSFVDATSLAARERFCRAEL